MDIRIMEYFLAVVREGNISAAAEALHVSQPSLSRQMKDLEEELGVTLFERGHRKITLTEEGMILRKRAEDIIRLMQMTENELANAHRSLSGEIHIGAGESKAFHYLSRPAGEMHRDHPDVRFFITSGDTEDLIEELDSGLLDIALIFTEFDRSVYNGIKLPEVDRLGVIMRKDSPLAKKEQIAAKDLSGISVFYPRAAAEMLQSDPYMKKVSLAAVYNLIYNASLLVEDGVGCAIGFDGLVDVSPESSLTFRPLMSDLHQQGFVIWKKYQKLSPAVSHYLELIQQQFSEHNNTPVI